MEGIAEGLQLAMSKGGYDGRGLGFDERIPLGQLLGIIEGTPPRATDGSDDGSVLGNELG